jgi:signal transduction histidine kinase
MSRVWDAWHGWIASQIDDAEQVRMQFAIAPAALALGVVAALLQTVFYWNMVPRAWALLWFAGIVANHSWYVWLRYAFHKAAPRDDELSPWVAKHVLGLLVCGLNWGLSALVFGLPLSNTVWPIMLMTLAGTAVTSLAVFTSFFPAHLVFTTALLIPVQLVSLARATQINTIGTALCVVLLLILLAQGHRQGRSLLQVLRIRRENERLVGQLQQENTAKENALVQATQATDAKTRFFSAVSHDVRQPLYSLSLLMTAVRGAHESSERDALLDRMQQSVDMLDGLFTQLLEVSALEARAMQPNFEPVALAPMLAEVTQVFEARARAKGLALTIDADNMWVHADRQCLQRVLVNLLSNATNYTEQGSVVLAARECGDVVVLSVRDSGSGIAPAMQERIFEEFFRGAHAQAHTSSNGFGLGLPIVRRLLRAMNTDVHLQSTPGKGSVFSFNLRVSPPPTQAPVQVAADIDVLTGATIGVIEDDPAAAQALAHVLRMWGAHVVVASCSDEALAWTAPLDALITDYQLGPADAFNGVEVAAALQSCWRRDGNPLLPVLVVSSLALDTSQTSGLPLANKPVPPVKLRAWLLHALAARAINAG